VTPNVKIYDCPINTAPKVSRREAQNADLIVLRHSDKGLWTLWKYRDGLPVRSVPFDSLPRDVKGLVGRSL
jgi:hypothetical protein